MLSATGYHHCGNSFDVGARGVQVSSEHEHVMTAVVLILALPSDKQLNSISAIVITTADLSGTRVSTVVMKNGTFLLS